MRCTGCDCPLEDFTGRIWPQHYCACCAVGVCHICEGLKPWQRGFFSSCQKEECQKTVLDLNKRQK